MPPDDPRRGTLLLVGAAATFSVMSVLVKAGTAMGLPVLVLILARSVVSLGLSYGAIRRAGLSPWGVDRPRLLLRGLFGLGGLTGVFTAFSLLPLADVTALFYLNPVLTTLLAAVLLRERIGWRLVVALTLGVVGTVLVARPAIFFAGASLPWPGVLAALGGAVSAACAYVTVRRLRRTDHPDVIVFYFPLVAVPAVLPFALSVWVWPSPLEWALLLVLGVVVQTAQVLLTRGLALIPAGQGTAVGYVQIAFAAAWGWLLFGEVPSVAAALGAGAIFAAALLSSRR